VAAYATGLDLIARCDVDQIGDLATDDREPLDRDAVATHPNVLAALLDASGEIDVALLVGGRYTPDQLAALTGNTMNHLIRITCSLAIALLCERRPSRVSAEEAEAYRKTARAHLDALRRGENVFGIPAVLESGVIDTVAISAMELESLNGITERMNRYFPTSNTRLPR
jgi:phage gp36-like protein